MSLKFAASSLFAMVLAAYASPNLVVNGGFDTGDFTGWTIMASPAGCSDFGIANNPADFLSGTGAAFFAGSCVGVYDTIMQDIPTTIGDDYNFTFFVNNTNNVGSASDFQAFWDGALVQDLPGMGNSVYTEYSFTEAAAATATPIAFQGYNQPADYYLDDVSVTDLGPASLVAVPEPPLAVLLCSGLGLVLLARRLRLRTA